ncbi:Rhs family protein [Candidatus Burkholderia humilis]|nr:Rhs family protein [Candidatus Burkholderia humilis]
MTAIHENGGGVLASFGYDDLGRRTSCSLANGTSMRYGYDAMSRLTSLDLNGGTNATSVTLGNYNPAGEIGSRSNGNDAYAWMHAVNVSRNYVANGLNQFTKSGDVALSYDARGNLTTSGTSTYGYDSKNELITANGFSAYYGSARTARSVVRRSGAIRI